MRPPHRPLRPPWPMAAVGAAGGPPGAPMLQHHNLLLTWHLCWPLVLAMSPGTSLLHTLVAILRVLVASLPLG